MKLRARTAGASITHHPEIVLLVAVDDVLFGIEAHGAELGGPNVPCLGVARGRIS